MRDGATAILDAWVDLFRAAGGLTPAGRLKSQLREIWHACGLVVNQGPNREPWYPVLMRHRKRDYGLDLLLHLPAGLCIDDFRARQNKIAWALNAEVEMENINGKLLIRVMDRPLPRLVSFEYLIPPGEMALPVPIGYSRAGMEWVDLAAAPHMLVAGTTGSGKSNLLHVILAYLWGKAEVSIIDMKRLEYHYAAGCATLAQDERSAAVVVDTLNRELNARLGRLQAAGCVKIQDYAGGDMPYKVLIIDELAELRSDDVLAGLDRLLRLARAVGISLILATQRPSVKVLDGDSRAMLDARVCYKTVDELNSRMVLGETHGEAAHLPVEGRAILRWKRYREVQTMFLPVSQARGLVPRVVLQKEPDPATHPASYPKIKP